MIINTLPSQDELWSVFDYEPDEGVLRWAIDIRFNAPAGSRAGGMTKNGYVRVKYNHKNYMTHRIIWKMIYGDEPEEIDHKNEVKNDNRIANLRDATHSQNKHNTKLLSISTSGLKGVHWRKGKNWCVAQITKDNVKYYLGTFYTAEEAYAAYVAKAKELFGEFANYGQISCP